MAENIDLSMLDVLDPQDLDHEQKVIYLSCVPQREKGCLQRGCLQTIISTHAHICQRKETDHFMFVIPCGM